MSGEIPVRILLIASAVGPLGDGATGGVSDVVCNTACELARRGHSVNILAAATSTYNGPGRLIGIDGAYQPTILMPGDASSAYPIVASSLIANYWHYAHQHQGEYGVIINFCHDWLPFYLTSFMETAVLHVANVCNENTAVTRQIQLTAQEFPHRVGVMSVTQAADLGIRGKSFVCGYGIDLSWYPMQSVAEKDRLIWCARISSEKGLEDAAEIACRTGKKLTVCGYMQDRTYFERIMERYGTVIDYRGFLDKAELANELGRAEAMLCTSHGMEAFGVVVIEALACGTPVITYDCGGPTEIVQQGKTGFVIAAGHVDEAVARVGQLPLIDREDCRQYCEEAYALCAYGDRIEGWIKSIGTK